MNGSDIDYLHRCLALAERARHTARPNPAVGCVLVKNGTVLAEGWTQPPGQAHAEVHALQQAGAAARGATAYVSLEPCAHQGRTGPCALALVDAGVGAVVYAAQDPNPLVAGKGLALLREAGIQLRGPLLEAEAVSSNPGFHKRMREGLPYLRCKLAMSLDGRTAMASGESKWITGEEARADVQYWRARSCAVMSGVDTVLQDDAALNVRLPDFSGSQPLRVIVDSRLRLAPGARTLRLPGEVLLACAAAQATAEDSLRAALGGDTRLSILELPDGAGRVDLSALLRWLAAERHCNEILLEAGPTLAGALLQAGLVDELLLYTAPTLLGDEARPLLILPGLQGLDQAPRLRFLDVAMVGKDCRMRTLVLR